MNELVGLQRIRGSLAKNASRDRLKAELTPVFADLLEKGNSAFQTLLATRSVSDFPNTLASRRLSKSFERRLPSVLRWRSDGATFSFAFRSNPQTQQYGDPAQYVQSIDDANNREGGPSKERVRRWLINRGILRPGQLSIKLRNGRSVTVRRFIYMVQRSIWRKTRQHAYASLRISKMFEELVDIKNPQGTFRIAMRRKLTNVVLGT